MKSFILEAGEINELLGVLEGYVEGALMKITKKVHNELELDCASEYGGDSGFLHKFLGFSVKKKQDGEHKTDYQLVTYTWTFISPSKKKTVIETDMSLMNGWSVNEDVKFKV